MVNYNLGKIYRIVCKTTGLVYIGSTAEPTLARRLATHSRKYKCFLNGKGRFVTSYKILENNNYEIILIENTPVILKMNYTQERDIILKTMNA